MAGLRQKYDKGLWPSDSSASEPPEGLNLSRFGADRSSCLLDMQTKTYTTEFAGKPLMVEIGRLAQQANGSVRVQYGETTVLVTATMSATAGKSDFFPLKIDYEERYYAAGKIKGSKWIKRETRPSDDAILTRRLIDRPLRPRFDQRIRHDIQIVATVLSFDGINDPDIPTIFGASLALSISDIPFNGPIAAVRIGKTAEGALAFNPTYAERIDNHFDIVIAGTKDRINMIEAGAKFIPEQEITEAITKGFEEVKNIIAFQEKITKEIAPVKKVLDFDEPDAEFQKVVTDFLSSHLEKALYTPSKAEYIQGVHTTEVALDDFLKEKYKDDATLGDKIKQAAQMFDEEVNRVVHKNILEKEKRPDGRKLDELRTLNSDVTILPHSHGTGLFERGDTQVLSVLTLAAPGLEQWVETMELELTKKRFMHHYVFPPFSVGEVGRVGFPGGREIGHGALAERALEPIIPPKDKFPYTIRLVSEVLSSNGSSSMASVCASVLALMDGGVPITTPVAGIAMGLILDETGERYKILTDIQGPEDHHGDMDLKVAGNEQGITAMQMDVKIDGITLKMLSETLTQARTARLQIMETMKKAIANPREDISKYAPRVETIMISVDKIRTVIGPQGKTINEIIDKTGVTIDIEQDGTVFITSNKAEAMKEAIEWIRRLTYEVKAGDEFDGKVTRLLDFGAMVEYMSGNEGLVHVSEISKERIKSPADVLKLGQVVHVKVKNIDEYGRINLTMK